MTAGEWSALWLSLASASIATALFLPVAVMLGRWLARARFRGRGLVESVFVLPLVVPPVVTGYLLLVVFSPESWVGGILSAWGIRIVLSFPGAIVCAGVVSFPLMVLGARAAFESVDPGLEAAAATLGASPWRVFWSVTLPQAWGGILAGGMLAFARALGEFGATIVVAGNIAGRTRTLPLAVYTKVMAGRGAEAWRLALIAALLGIAATWFAGRIAGIWSAKGAADA